MEQPIAVEFTLEELRALFPEVKAEWLGSGRRIRGISTDSRRVLPGSVFVALRGSRVDAHTRLAEAFAAGAAMAIVEQRSWRQFPADWQRFPCVPVVNPLQALGQLARLHRLRFRIPVVAVVGSAGKTTTKELIAAVLARRFRVLATPGNFNNQLGVPLTLLQLRPEHQVAVVELGTNSFGEIARLVQIACPTHGVVTALGAEHLEFLGSVDGVVQEETALLRALRDTGGMAILPAWEPALRQYHSERTLWFGLSPAPDVVVWAESIQPRVFPMPVRLSYGGALSVLELRLPGQIGVRAAAAAAAVAWALGVDAESVVGALSEFAPESTHGYARMAIEHIPPGVTVLNDTYNANPLSMHMALQVLQDFPARGRRIAVLGDMLELGAAAGAAHREVLEHAQRVAEWVFVLGEQFRACAHGQPKVCVCSTHEEALQRLQEVLQPGDVVLLKGSRGMRMEAIVEQWRRQADAVPSDAVDLAHL